MKKNKFELKGEKKRDKNQKNKQTLVWVIFMQKKNIG